MRHYNLWDLNKLLMLVRHLSLTNFRLYARLELDLPRGLAIVQGDNAQGKTSLLEAMYFLATSHSPHTSADRQVQTARGHDRKPARQPDSL